VSEHNLAEECCFSKQKILVDQSCMLFVQNNYKLSNRFYGTVGPLTHNCVGRDIRRRGEGKDGETE
jgi:hypothetical protein